MDGEGPPGQPLDYERLFQELRQNKCRVDRIIKVFEAPGRKPVRTRASLIDRELEASGSIISDLVLLSAILGRQEQGTHTAT